MKKIKVFEKTFNDANILKCKVGTTGYCGGDSGHGSKTIFELENLSGTDMKAIVTDNNGNGSIRIELGGDSELTTFIKALEYATHVLEGIAGKVAPYPFMNSGADKMFISSDCRIINFDNAYSIQIDSEKPSRLICTLVGQDDDYFYLVEFKDKEQAKLALRCIERRILYGYRIIDIENIKKEVEAYTEVTL